MKRLPIVCFALSIVCTGWNANAVSVQQAATADTNVARSGVTSTSGTRGNAASAAAYKQNQVTTYYLVNTPDVDSACRSKIYACLADYCGDVTVVPGQRTGGCTYATESELYNYTLLCLQKDTTALLPTYSTSFKTSAKGMNTAARLCPSYVQQELLSYLSMANMSEQLLKQHSSTCIDRRQEVEAAMACHSVALAYGNETSSKLNTQLNDFCGSGVPGGSAEMVQKFSTAGNVGANIWGWAEKIVNLDLSKKGDDWQSAMDAVLVGYINRMNLACGENMQINTTAKTTDNGQPTTLQTAAAVAVGMAFPSTTTTGSASSGGNAQSNTNLWHEVQSLSDVYDYATAKQVVQAGLTNAVTTQNAFLTSAQMGDMQKQYKLGTKVYVLRDTARCYMVPVQTLTTQESALLAQTFASCKSQ